MSFISGFEGTQGRKKEGTGAATGVRLTAGTTTAHAVKEEWKR